MLIFKSELSELITDKWPRTTFSCFQVGGGGVACLVVYTQVFFFLTHMDTKTGHKRHPSARWSV